MIHHEKRNIVWSHHIISSRLVMCFSQAGAIYFNYQWHNAKYIKPHRTLSCSIFWVTELKKACKWPWPNNEYLCVCKFQSGEEQTNLRYQGICYCFLNSFMSSCAAIIISSSLAASETISLNIFPSISVLNFKYDHHLQKDCMIPI